MSPSITSIYVLSECACVHVCCVNFYNLQPLISGILPSEKCIHTHTLTYTYIHIYLHICTYTHLMSSLPLLSTPVGFPFSLLLSSPMYSKVLTLSCLQSWPPPCLPREGWAGSDPGPGSPTFEYCSYKLIRRLLVLPVQ